MEEHVLGPNEIKVYETLADVYDRERKGKGTRCTILLILGMYRNWAHEMYPYEDPDVVLERVRKLKNNAQVRNAMHSFMDMGLGEDEDGDTKKGKASAKKTKENKRKSGDGEDVDDDDEDIVGDDVEFPDDSDGGEDEEEYSDVEFPDDDDDEDEDAMDAMREAEGLTKPKKKKKKNSNKKAENMFDDAVAPRKKRLCSLLQTAMRIRTNR